MFIQFKVSNTGEIEDGCGQLEKNVFHLETGRIAKPTRSVNGVQNNVESVKVDRTDSPRLYEAVSGLFIDLQNLDHASKIHNGSYAKSRAGSTVPKVSTERNGMAVSTCCTQLQQPRPRLRKQEKSELKPDISRDRPRKKNRTRLSVIG